MSWTKADLEKTGLKNNLTDSKPVIAIPKSQPKGLTFIINYLHYGLYKYETEYKFLPDRKFRFDVAVFHNDLKIAVEYDGLISEKSRHTTISGFTMDAEKSNLAQINGWIFLRYTTINYKDFPKNLEQLIDKS